MPKQFEPVHLNSMQFLTSEVIRTQAPLNAGGREVMKSNDILQNCIPTYVSADRVRYIPRSGIREILMAAQGRKIISFGGGVPHDSCVPLDTIADAFESVMSRYGARAFRYGASEGETELREYIAGWLNGLGLPAKASDILIVNGSQQALDLLGKVLINPGAHLLVERPTYLAALQAFAAYEPRYDEVIMDDEGPVPECIRSKLRKHKHAFFYTIPSFQNPSGTCCGLSRRAQIVDILNREGCLVVEDDPYSQLYYDQAPPPPISAMGAERAVFLGTFSKMVSPGFRLGWVWSNTGIIEAMITVKQAADLCTGLFQQLLLCEVLKRLDLKNHLERNRSFYTGQRDKMNLYMNKYLSDKMEWNNPRGGMFFWASLRNGTSAQGLLRKCLKRDVAFADGASFFAGEKELKCMRLNFTQCSEEEMESGLKIMAEEIEAPGLI